MHIKKPVACFSCLVASVTTCAIIFCKFCTVWDIGTAANILGLVLMSVDHFVAVRWPLKHHILLSKSTLEVIIGISWILACILWAIYYIGNYKTLQAALNSTMDDVNGTFSVFCKHWLFLSISKVMYEELRVRIYKDASLTFVLSGFVFVAIAFMYCYVSKVTVNARKTKSFFQNHSQSSSKSAITSDYQHSSATSTTSFSNAWFKQVRKRLKLKRCIRTTMLFLGSFAVLWTPILICLVLILVKSSAFVAHGMTIAIIDRSKTVAVCMTTITDVIIYFVRSNELERPRKRKISVR